MSPTHQRLPLTRKELINLFEGLGYEVNSIPFGRIWNAITLEVPNEVGDGTHMRVAINSDDEYVEQTISLAHEFAHLFLGDSFGGLREVDPNQARLRAAAKREERCDELGLMFLGLR